MMDMPIPQSSEMPRPLRIGDLAPDFQARTTQGEVKLSGFQRRWLLFFSHPADFTPVCTTEFVAFARAADRFAALDCALLGLSVDSLYAHLAWLRAIQEAYGVTIPFPLIEDPSMAIARAYGMIDETSPDSTTVRASYVIDPRGVVRAISWYPHNIGRSVEEMLRLVAALRAAEETGGLVPEGWQPGAPLLAPPPIVVGELADGADWFCRPAGAP
ncbi:MAG: peroxiredoxin [Rhodospirillales bacterium]|nr:peroxiredoxin [Rhodospirillales bacterium]